MFLFSVLSIFLSLPYVRLHTWHHFFSILTVLQISFFATTGWSVLPKYNTVMYTLGNVRSRLAGPQDSPAWEGHMDWKEKHYYWQHRRKYAFRKSRFWGRQQTNSEHSQSKEMSDSRRETVSDLGPEGLYLRPSKYCLHLFRQHRDEGLLWQAKQRGNLGGGRILTRSHAWTT